MVAGGRLRICRHDDGIDLKVDVEPGSGSRRAAPRERRAADEPVMARSLEAGDEMHVVVDVRLLRLDCHACGRRIVAVDSVDEGSDRSLIVARQRGYVLERQHRAKRLRVVDGQRVDAVVEPYAIYLVVE